MTYQEIQERVSKCKIALNIIKDRGLGKLSQQSMLISKKKLELLKESLERKLEAVEFEDEKKAAEFSKDNPDVTVKLKSEQQEIEYSVEETRVIALEIAKTLVSALREVGDEVARGTVKDIMSNSFTIYIEYKNNFEDEFSFYITGGILHLVDDSFDKEIGEVGIKPSGEPLVHKDLVKNNLVKYFNSLNEQEYSKDIEVGADEYEENIGLADIEEMGYEAGEEAFEKIKGRFKNKPDHQAYRKGFFQGFIDNASSYGLNEDLDLGHEDNEPHMLKADLYRIGKYAMELYKMVDQFEGVGEVDFPAWWQAKITNAKTAIVGAKHYLDFELKEPEIDSIVSLDEIGMFHDPKGYEKSKPEKPTYTKKYLSKGVYDIFKNGKKVKTIKGSEGDANAYINQLQREMSEGMSEEEWAKAKEEDRLAQLPMDQQLKIKKMTAMLKAEKKPKKINEAEIGEETPRQRYLTLFDIYKKASRSDQDRLRPGVLKAAKKIGIKLDLGNINEAPKGVYYIKVAVRDARKAIMILDDKYYKEVIYNGSDSYYFSSEETAYDALEDFGGNDIEVVDTNLDLFAENKQSKTKTVENFVSVSYDKGNGATSASMILTTSGDVKLERNKEIKEESSDSLSKMKELARKESEQGYVQHVNKLPNGGYRVEDWYDSDNTVFSYEGGELLEGDSKKEQKLNEEKATCCGRCGRVHKKSTECKKPYLSKSNPKHCKNK